MDAISFPPVPVNEPNLTYAPGSAGARGPGAELARLERRQHNLRAYINGRRRSAAAARSTSYSRTTTSTCWAR